MSTSTPESESLTAEQHAAHEQAQAHTNARVARATGIVALGNILSRVLGLAREMMLSNVFGASRAVEAFNNALVISKSLYDLLLAGHVNSAIVPVLSEVASVQGQRELWRLVSVLMSIVTVFATGITLLLVIFAPQIVGLISGTDPQTIALSAQLLQFTAPMLILLTLFAVFSGTLYALRAFSLPALAGAVFNGTIVLVTLALIPPLEPAPSLRAGGVVWTLQRPTDGIIAVAVAWLVASGAQLALQVYGLRHARLRFTFNWRHPSVRRIGILYVPVLFSLVIDTLVIRFFSYNLAARTSIAHGNTYMNWATTLIQFPHGLVATAISIAILPTLSRQAALIANADSQTSAQNQRAYKDTLGLGLRLATILIVPATVGLYVTAEPIIRLLFEHGAFTATDTAITTQALHLYLFGLPFAAIDLLLVYAFYARQDTLTPALIGVISLAVYTVVALLLQDSVGLYSLMIADSVKHIVHATLSAALLWIRLEGLGGQALLLTLLKTSAASVVMGLATWAAVTLSAQILPAPTLLNEIMIVALALGVGALAYLGLAWALRIDEMRWLMQLIRKRFAS